jgi:hypothetical protein
MGPDASGDGVPDIFANNGGGWMALVSGTDGTVFREIAAETWVYGLGSADAFGADIDGDGLGDVLLGTRAAIADSLSGDVPGSRPDPGFARLYSATGELLHEWVGDEPCRSLGAMVDMGPDVNGDGVPDLLIGDPGCIDYDLRPPPAPPTIDGRVMLVSGATFETLQTIAAPPGMTNFGLSGARFVPDVDGDGVADVLIVTDYPDEDGVIQFYSSRSAALAMAWEVPRDLQVLIDGVGRDFDGDGSLEALARASSENATFTLGHFSPRPTELREIAAAFAGRSRVATTPDLDGDGATDIVGISGWVDGGDERLLGVYNYRGDAFLTMDDVSALAYVTSGQDLNMDGRADLAVTDYDTVREEASLRLILSTGSR